MGVITFHPDFGFPKTGTERHRKIQQDAFQFKIEPPAENKIFDSIKVDNRAVRSENILSRWVVSEDRSGFEQLSSIFRSVSDAVIRRCIQFGSGYYLLSRESLDRLFHDLPGRSLSFPGGYSPALKACILQITALGREFLPLILLAHAYDHALGGDHFASRQSPLLQSLYLACKRRKRNHQFMSGYGESGPMEYFAESVAFYFSPDKAMREILKQYDRAMFDFLEMILR